jgi:O-6-methylguanine DNA methyltransferase
MRQYAVKTELGALPVAFAGAGVCGVSLDYAHGLCLPELELQEGRDGYRVAAALRAIARGEPVMEPLPLDLSCGTPFQQEVWLALRRIPFGHTRSYGEVAASINRPGAARAVGNACNANPLPLLVPCHRVVAARGIGGFGSGLAMKRRLLRLEGIA